VLDVGCGSGRWTYAMASLGARVVATDLTAGGAEVTRAGTQQFSNVQVLQASAFELPFRPETFDLVVSWGVLHHTPDTRRAFGKVAPFVKRAGQLYIMVYERHNPLKYFFTDLIRSFLRRLPEGRRYDACRYLIIKNRFLRRVLSNRIICAAYPPSGDALDVTTAQLGLFDAYAPVFNHLHTRSEVAGWFTELGFGDLTLTRPVRFTRPRDVYYQGECGGSVNMRGTRL